MSFTPEISAGLTQAVPQDLHIQPEQAVASEEASRLQQAGHRVRQALGRGALVLGLAAGGLTAATAAGDTPAYAAGYPHADAAALNAANYDWWVDENGNGAYNSGELISPRGYAYRNCTDYAAWRIKDLTGVTIPANLGNAKNWDNNAPSGYVVNNTPEVGDLAVWDGGTFGHVAVVESVNANGSVNVSQYNRAGDGNYSTEANRVADHYIDVNGEGNGGSSGGGGVPGQLPADLYEIHTFNTPTGLTEIKTLPAAQNYGQWGGGYVVNDSIHHGSEVDYGMGDFNSDTVQDVIKIQHNNTASGATEVRVFNGAGNLMGGNPLVTPDGLHGANDVDYVVADYNRDGRPDVYRIMHWNTGSGKTEVRVLDGATNYSTWLTGTFVTPDGWHGGEGVDYAASTCGTTNHPNLYVVLHQGTNQGKTEIKRLDGASNYAGWNGGWNSIDGEHSADDVNYTAGGCNANTGLPDMYLILHKNTNTGHTEVKRMNGGLPGSASYSAWNGGWNTPDGEHSSNDVDFVMAQRNN